MNAFERLSLKTNPFRTVPASNENELVWAGFRDVKEKIERRIKRSIQIPNTSLVLNWGEYGSGKTHAAKYFSKEDVLRELAGEYPIPFSTVINFPKSKDPVKDIFTQIIDRIEIDDLRLKIKTSIRNPVLAIEKATDNLFLRNLLKAIFLENSNPLIPEIDELIIKGYLYGEIPPKKLLNEGILRGLSSDMDYTEFLGALFSLMTYESKVYSCINIWIDEFEDISILSNTNITNVNNFIRTIIDKTPNNLLIFINLTQSAMMDLADLGEYLHESVKSRIKERINLEIPSPDVLKDYVNELLNNPVFRYGNVGANCYMPFDEKVIDELIKDLKTASLRRYNEAFSFLLENAAFDKLSRIDEDYYNSIKDEIIGWKD